MVLENYYSDIRMLSIWFHKNRLQLNAEKCYFINFGFKKLNSDIESLKIHKYTCTSDGVCVCPDMQKQMETKYLGLILDDKLIWGSHCVYLGKKLGQLNYLFYHLSQYFSRTHLLNLYTSLYESILSYGIIH